MFEKALTLDELREMDGIPVWNDTVKEYMLVDLKWEYGERAVGARGEWRDLFLIATIATGRRRNNIENYQSKRRDYDAGKRDGDSEAH